MAKKAYIGVENFTPRELPNGYTQVEYIESSGTQYIDTGFKPNQNTKMILKMAMLADLTSKNATGVRNSSSDATNRFGIVVYTAQGKFGGFFGTNGISGATADTNVHVHELGPDGYIVDGVSYGTMSSTTFSVSYNIPLLSWSNGSNGNEPITGRLYSCQLYYRETLARDFVPCIVDSTGEVGLYDLVNGGFYQNAGSGAFTAGNTHGGYARKIKKGYIGVENFTPRTLPSGYTQIEYIQSSGTQWIDTGFKPNHNTRVVADCYLDSAASTMSAFGAWTGTSTNAFIHAGKSDNSACVFFYGTGNTSISVPKTGRHLIDFNMNEASIDGVSASATTQTFSCTYSMFLMAYNSAGSAANKATGKLYSCRVYDNGVMVRDFVPCTNSSGTAGLYDLVNAVFYQNAGTGTFTSGSTHASLARKIKKAYIGIGGVARPCWAGGTITKYGTIDATSDNIENSAGASNGDYAIFAGGSIYSHSGNGTQTDSVFAYSKSLTLSKPDVLYTAVMDLSATNVGDYAVFAGGQLATVTDYKRYVTAYDKSLTRTFPSTLYNNACYMSAANAGGNYAVFVGGYYGTASYGWTAYDSSLTMKTGDMANYRYKAAATSLGDCAVFAGGEGYGILSSCETIDSSLTRTTRGDLSVARYELSAAHVGKYAIFAGGYNQKGPVDVYNESFTRSALGNIATDGSRYHIAATQVDGFAIFAGGVFSLTVDLYDESLTHTLAENLTNKRAYSCAASVGDYALIFGGRGTLNGEDVEIYMLA